MVESVEEPSVERPVETRLTERLAGAAGAVRQVEVVRQVEAGLVVAESTETELIRLIEMRPVVAELAEVELVEKPAEVPLTQRLAEVGEFERLVKVWSESEIGQVYWEEWKTWVEVV